MDSHSDDADEELIKSKQIDHRRRYCRNKKRKRIPCSSSSSSSSKVAVVPTMDPLNTSATSSHGFISVIGRRRAMEDAVKVVPSFVTPKEDELSCGDGGYDFFAVYDGHGGTTVANACRDRLHLLLAEEVKEICRRKKCEEEDINNGTGMDWYKAMFSCFMKMDHQIGGGGGGGDHHEDEDDDDDDEDCGNTMGSTAAVVVIGKEEIVVANCGDSRAVLCRGGVPVPLSRDHKPDLPDERERIEAAGGRVIDWNGGNRVLGVLATSRSIGDHCMKPFVISQPEIKVYRRTKSDEFVVVASDGLWDVVSNNFVCQVVGSCLQRHMMMKNRNIISSKEEDNNNLITKTTCAAAAAEAAAVLLAELAMARGSKDNISVIVIQLNKPCITT